MSLPTTTDRPGAAPARRASVALALLGALTVGGCADAGGGYGATTATSTAVAPDPTTPTTAATPSATAATPSGSAVSGTTRLTSPAQGASVAGPTVTFTGEATAFEGTVSWVVHPVGGSIDEPTVDGFTQAGANGDVQPFEFTADLAPGEWVVEVFEASARDGAPTNVVSVTFTVS